jgi:hypothetical protein
MRTVDCLLVVFCREDICFGQAAASVTRQNMGEVQVLPL